MTGKPFRKAATMLSSKPEVDIGPRKHAIKHNLSELKTNHLLLTTVW